MRGGHSAVEDIDGCLEGDAANLAGSKPLRIAFAYNSTSCGIRNCAKTTTLLSCDGNASSE